MHLPIPHEAATTPAASLYLSLSYSSSSTYVFMGRLTVIVPLRRRDRPLYHTDHRRRHHHPSSEGEFPIGAFEIVIRTYLKTLLHDLIHGE